MLNLVEKSIIDSYSMIIFYLALICNIFKLIEIDNTKQHNEQNIYCHLSHHSYFDQNVECQPKYVCCVVHNWLFFGATIITSMLTLDNIYLCALGVSRSFVFCRAVSQILFWLQIARNIRTKQMKNINTNVDSSIFQFFNYVNLSTRWPFSFKNTRKHLEVIY